ncbi:helix-turn-helix domain-containing protein [Catellatospora bangladeshensis]|uniref:AlbA family DNA-binding domain-containing protein n=1 Tax=Catellatospora bangladeshensis TaxID=310355 RepID=UPI003618ED37
MIKALQSGKAKDLLGQAENPWLDFKATPYPANDKGKFDISKDVAAFANAQGGMIVCGIKTKRDDNEARDIADSLHPFPQANVKIESYKDVLNDYLWPRVAVEYHWFPDPDSEESGHYLVIEVEPVPERDRYVIVRRSLNDKGQLADGFVIPERRGDGSVSVLPDAAYRLINEGYRRVHGAERYFTEAELAGIRFEAIGRPELAADPFTRELATEGIDHMEQRQEWQNTPVLYWQSLPAGRVDLLSGMFGSANLEGKLRDQDVLRFNGFNFADRLGQLTAYAGGLYLDKTRCALWIRPDGSVTAGAVATPELLCWAMEQRGTPNRINSLVLTEMTLEYFRIADDLVAPLNKGSFEHRILARRFGEINRVCSGQVRSSTYLFHAVARPARMSRGISLGLLTATQSVTHMKL